MYSVLLLVLYGYGTWSLTLKEECRLMVFASRVAREVFGPVREELTGGWEYFV